MGNKLKHISIFTATYNRGHLLRRLFTSLKEQSYANFEWIIVDDGSTDETNQIISKIKNEAFFDVIYKKQENQGKHIAINTGVTLANGNYFFIVDSDDRLPKNALEVISNKIEKIREDNAIAGVVGLKCFFDKKIVGFNPLKKDVICDIFDYRYKYNATGDRAEVLKTSILKEFPFPKFEEEKFIPESIVWNRIAQHYQMLFFNENVYECEYLDTGLSAQSIKLRRKYPKGVMHLYAELSTIKKITITHKLKANVNYWRFFFCEISNALENLKILKQHHFTFLCLPLGFLLYTKDSLFLREKQM